MAPRTRFFNVDKSPVLVLVAKALGAKQGGIAAADRKNLTDVGKFEHDVTLQCHLEGNVGGDHEGDRSYGVPTDKIIHLAQRYSGGVRPHLERAAFVMRELTTADLEGREVQDVTYTNGEGEEVTITAETVAEARHLLEDDSDIVDLSKKIKVKRPVAGRIDLDVVEVKIVEPSGIQIPLVLRDSQPANQE